MQLAAFASNAHQIVADQIRYVKVIVLDASGVFDGILLSYLVLLEHWSPGHMAMYLSQLFEIYLVGKTSGKNIIISVQKNNLFKKSIGKPALHEKLIEGHLANFNAPR